MFQLKKSEGYRAAIEKHQIDEASTFNPIKERSFILTVDSLRGEIKINSINEVSKDFSKVQDTKTFDCSDWDPLADWVIKWLKCEVGAGNRPNDPMPIEKLLESQLKDQREKVFDNSSFDLPYFITPKYIHRGYVLNMVLEKLFVYLILSGKNVKKINLPKNIYI